MLGEARLARFVEDADAEHDRLAGLEARQVVAEGAGFLRAARRVVLRIEVQNDRLPGVVAEPVGLAVLIFQTERGRFLSGLDERPRCLLCDRIADSSTAMIMLKTIDAHAGGEPLRLIVEGFPAPRGKTMLEKREWVAGTPTTCAAW